MGLNALPMWNSLFAKMRWASGSTCMCFIPLRRHEKMHIDESLPTSPLRLRRGGQLVKRVLFECLLYAFRRFIFNQSDTRPTPRGVARAGYTIDTKPHRDAQSERGGTSVIIRLHGHTKIPHLVSCCRNHCTYLLNFFW